MVEPAHSNFAYSAVSSTVSQGGGREEINLKDLVRKDQVKSELGLLDRTGYRVKEEASKTHMNKVFILN